MSQAEEASDHPQPNPGIGAGRGPWRFRDVESLWDALERYHHYHESCRVRGLRVGDGTGYAVGIEMTDQWAMFM